MPPAELNPTTYAQKCKSITDSLVSGGANVTFEEVAGEDLKDGGYGGIYGVGMAAQCPPRMVVMTYTPDGGDWTEHVALCGKVSVSFSWYNKKCAQDMHSSRHTILKTHNNFDWVR